MKLRTSTLLAIALLPLAVQAQPTVWRCGADGRSYGDAPCADGRPVQVADARSAAMVADARALAGHERVLAQQWTSERRAADAQAARQGAAALSVPALTPRGPLQPAKVQRPKRQRPDAGAGTSRRAGRASPRAPG